MYPSEMPYFNTENPVVRDELWDELFYYIDKDCVEEEKNFEIDWTFDAKKLSENKLENLLQKLERYINVEVFLEDDGSIEVFKVYGECNEETYDVITSYLDDYNVAQISA